MKRTTYFKPSIHGWPFGNSWDWTIDFLFPSFVITLNSVGFCGGMCWTALDRFYNGVCTPRDTPAPSYGDPLYGEVEQAQMESVNDAGKLLKMYEWQMSPKLSGHWGNPHRSLGLRTLTEWNKNIKRRFASISPNNNKPVTLTLIRTSNDYDPTHLVQHHRVVAYGYEERALIDGEYVHGETKSKIKHVKLYIYDPNHPYIYDPDNKNDDDVYLSFYTNCDDDWISLKHSKGDKAAGFFMDDIPRAYSSDELPELQIEKIELTEITSESRAQFDLQFRWECRVIPYFSIQIDGVDWKDNESVMENYLPEGDIKQCPTKTGDITVNLDLPRETSTVSVRFLDDESFTASENVSVGEPTFRCSPYYWGQNEPIKEHDFYFKDKDPSESALNQLSIPISRIIPVRFPAAWECSKVAFPWADMMVDGHINSDIFNAPVLGELGLPVKKYLGNVKKALYANFSVKNFALPTEISATITTTKNGQTASTDSLSSLSKKDAYLLGGFSAADYDDDTEVKITFKCTDRFGLVLEDEILLHGKSILEFSQYRLYPKLPPRTTIDTSDPGIRSKIIVKYEAAALQLVEMGVLDLKAKLQRSIDRDDPRPPDLRPGGRGPVLLQKALRSDRSLQRMIDKSSRAVWHDRRLWSKCLKYNSEALSHEYQSGVVLHHSHDKVDEMSVLKEHELEDQRQSDAVIIGAFSKRIIRVLRKDPDFSRALELL